MVFIDLHTKYYDDRYLDISESKFSFKFGEWKMDAHYTGIQKINSQKFSSTLKQFI